MKDRTARIVSDLSEYRSGRELADIAYEQGKLAALREFESEAFWAKLEQAENSQR